MAYLQCTIVTGSACVLQVRASGSLTNPTVFSVDGNQGRLLEVTDDLSCSLFSANTIAGLPVVEAFANYCVVMGQYGGHQLQVTCTSIRGGKCTTASGYYSVVSGGCCNASVGGPADPTAAVGSFVGGGYWNCAVVSLTRSAGFPNVAPFVGGGQGNLACASGAVVVGGGPNVISFGCAGTNNRAAGINSFVGGGSINIASGEASVVVGGSCNCATGAGGGTMSGNCNFNTGACSFIGGGCRNTNSGVYSFIGGGNQNCICSNNGNTISGGAGNLINTGNYNTIGGGISNCVLNSNRATVGGGNCNTASGNYSFVGGGIFNSAQASCSTTVGGAFNKVCVSANFGFIGGGCLNNNDGGGGSSILAGISNTIPGGAIGGNNTHIIGSCITGATWNYTYVNNLCQTGGGISDCRVKNTIQPLEFGLDHLAQLQPVSWCWNGDPTCHKKYGFIAQNVQQAMSCVVTCNPLHKLGPDGTQQVGGEGEPLLEFEKDAVYASYINAIKELKQENDQLKARVEAIEEVLKNNNLL